MKHAVPNAATAAAQRERCLAAAQALQHTPRRAQLAWQDLAAWPSWAALDYAALDALAWRVGVQWYGRAWQRCIDGAQLKHLHQRLGTAQLQALMEANEPAVPPQEHPQGEHADEALTRWGREVLLAALPAPALRVVLRETRWPQTLPPVPAPPQAVSQQVVVRALAWQEVSA